MTALKHYTSKLSSYDDLTSLETFGFRGEALSSLCALSRLQIVTARSDSGAKGSRLDFERSGELKATSVTAAPRGTTVVVEDIFHNLPVRQKELVRHIKREYSKLLGILQAYACIGEGVRFSLSNQIPKGKRNVVFATKVNPTTKENIANVFGAKTMSALIPIDLDLELKPTHSTQALSTSTRPAESERRVSIRGHMSKPSYGEGRQAPDRQMFFVNSRPCGLPQIAKAFNEAYRTYNVSQSPFVFANLIIDTNAYDVNVSPDKRTILLHDQPALLESLKDALANMFESYAPNVPTSQMPNGKLPSYTPLGPSRGNTIDSDEDDANRTRRQSSPVVAPMTPTISGPVAAVSPDCPDERRTSDDASEGKATLPSEPEDRISPSTPNTVTGTELETSLDPVPTAQTESIPSIGPIGAQKGVSGLVVNAFDRMRARRDTPELAEITIGINPTRTVMTGLPKPQATNPPRKAKSATTSKFASILRGFNASDALETTPGNTSSEYALDASIQAMSHSESRSVTPVLTQSSSPSSSVSGSPAHDEGIVDDDLLAHTQAEIGQDAEESGSESEYIDEEDKKIQEDRRVAEMIQHAEHQSSRASEENLRRAERVMKARHGRQGTINLVQILPTALSVIEHDACRLAVHDRLPAPRTRKSGNIPADNKMENADAEAKLSLSICKADFLRMRIIGQFNLGFILAYRRASQTDAVDQIFVIDQHAADEKFNFEHLSQTTNLAPQRLVQAKTLELSAQDEEILLCNPTVLERNGFQVDIDETGDVPSGRRCKLLSLPTSKGTTFGVADLEELIHLLSESIGSMSMDTDRPHNQQYIPRPSRVRRMLAMRACRSSIMVGKNLSRKQMTEVVGHMASMEKPWNCPHGRPTMRHLAGLDEWSAWREGDKHWAGGALENGTDWAAYMAARQRNNSEDEA